MKTKWTLLRIAGLLAMPPAMALAQATNWQPMVVGNLSGNMHIFQSIPFPCPDLEADVAVTGGRFEITPAEGLDIGRGARRFVMTYGNVTMRPFTLNVSCAGHAETRRYTALSVQVTNAVSFIGVPTGPDTFSFVIPQGDVLLHETATVNGGPEGGNSHPRDPVIGSIDLARGTMRMTVVVAVKIHVDGLGDFDGSLTTAISGNIVFPDADGDGVPDRDDNCRLVANRDQQRVSSPFLRAPVNRVLPSCRDTRIGAATAADICEDGPVTVINDAPHPFPPGRTVVTWKARDSHGRVSADTQAIIIRDRTPPVFTSVPADILLPECGPADLGLPTATDDCGERPTFTNDAPARFVVGDTVVTWTATDLSGNRATATQTVTVRDVPATARR